MQKVQNAAAGFVFRRYATVEDVINLKWLPVQESIMFSLGKLAHQGLYDKNHPSLMKLKKRELKLNLRECDSRRTKIDPKKNNLYEENVATVFNDMPEELKQIENFPKFKNRLFSYLRDVSLARLLNQF